MSKLEAKAREDLDLIFSKGTASIRERTAGWIAMEADLVKMKLDEKEKSTLTRRKVASAQPRKGAV